MLKNIDFKFNDHSWQVNIRDEADESVFNEIFKLNEYRAAEDVIKNAKHPIVDVGAHAGFFSMYCRGLNKKVKIFAIEPEPNNIKALSDHLKKNKILGVEVAEEALAGISGSGKLVLSEDSHNHFISPNEMEGSMFSSFTDRNNAKTIKVKIVAFSDFIKKNKLKQISLLKFDIEGGEYEVFDSMSEADLSVVNNVILEYHKGREKSKEIEEKLRINGFGVQVFPSKFDKTMGFLFAKNKRHL